MVIINYLLSFAITEINKMGVIFRFKIQKFAVAPVDKDLIKKSLAHQQKSQSPRWILVGPKMIRRN